MTNPFLLSELYIYPIKSLGGVSVQQAFVTERGLQHDRRWMLIDEMGRFLTQREHPLMALLQVEIGANELIINHKKEVVSPLEVPFETPLGDRVQVQIWDDEVEAHLLSEEFDVWFTNAIGFPCSLVYMPDDSFRKVDADYARNQEITSFSDAYPFLLIGQSSLDDLNTRLEKPVPINRFRPNLVFSGGLPYEEDTFYEFWVGTNQFFGVKPCARCVLTTVDQATAQKGNEPLRTLATYRTKNNKVLFGQNLLPGTLGIIRVGDEIEVMSRIS